MVKGKVISVSLGWDWERQMGVWRLKYSSRRVAVPALAELL